MGRLVIAADHERLTASGNRKPPRSRRWPQVVIWEAAPTRMTFWPPYAAPGRTVAVTSDGRRGAGVPSGRRPERQRKPRPSRPPLAGGRVGSGGGRLLGGR